MQIVKTCVSLEIDAAEQGHIVDVLMKLSPVLVSSTSGYRLTLPSKNRIVLHNLSRYGKAYLRVTVNMRNTPELDNDSIASAWSIVDAEVKALVKVSLTTPSIRQRIATYDFEVTNLVVRTVTAKIPSKYHDTLLNYIHNIYNQVLEYSKGICAATMLNLSTKQRDEGLTFARHGKGANVYWSLMLRPTEGHVMYLDYRISSLLLRGYGRSSGSTMLSSYDVVSKCSNSLKLSIREVGIASLLNPLPLSDKALGAAVKAWQSNKLKDRQRRLLTSSGYKVDLGYSFYQAVRDVVTHSRDHSRQRFNYAEWYPIACKASHRLQPQ